MPRLIIAAAVLTLAPLAQAAEPPRLEIASKSVKLTLCLPDAKDGFYRGPRFDWSGVVEKAEWNGHTYFGYWKSNRDPENHDDVPGTAEEFGIDVPPPGYEEAKPGETFLKIGIGELEKPKEAGYRFTTRYKVVRPGVWEVKSGPDWVELRQEVSARGYGYRYVKRMTVAKDAPSFTIERTLKNTGEKPIATTHYGHNFLTIDAEPVGPGYVLTFPFEPKPKDPEKLAGRAVIRGKELTYPAVLKGDVYIELGNPGGGKENHAVTIVNRDRKAGVRIVGDRPLARFNVWAVKTCVCAEPFVRVDLKPGEEMSWKTEYTFFAAE